MFLLWFIFFCLSFYFSLMMHAVAWRAKKIRFALFLLSAIISLILVSIGGYYYWLSVDCKKYYTQNNIIISENEIVIYNKSDKQCNVINSSNNQKNTAKTVDISMALNNLYH